MTTPQQLQSVRDYCSRIEAGKLEGFNQPYWHGQHMKNALEAVEKLFTVGEVCCGAQIYTRDDILCEILEGDTWLRSGDANVTVSMVNILLIDGYPDEATRLNNALFTECAVTKMWEDCE